MSKYNKLWIAIGLGAVFAGMKYFDVGFAGQDEVLQRVIEAAIVALGVYQVPNKG